MSMLPESAGDKGRIQTVSSKISRCGVLDRLANASRADEILLCADGIHSKLVAKSGVLRSCDESIATVKRRDLSLGQGKR